MGLIRRTILVLTGAALLAFNINTFVKAGGLFPGSFTGLALLVQEIFLRFAGIKIPFSVLLFTLNLAPAIICIMFVGRKFTIFSIMFIFANGFFTDLMPQVLPQFIINFLTTQDFLLSAVFGGLLNALAISLTLHAGASTGGTYFIGILISEKYNKDSWNYVFAINCVILSAAGILFGLDRALYSIILQFTATVALKALYKNYQQQTLFIVTNKPDDIFKTIHDMTRHGATLIDCVGSFGKETRTFLYSVVTAAQVKSLIPVIKRIDPAAFINVLKTEQLNGRFNQIPRD